ncbi:PREDICTED: nuclear pore complex protein NUP98A-like [Camelina sativa]|uniref:Nuclear pore complex protein NUP98A-like n=1 Tax=Camelina sativa TaxID=90675 RepID=A0ABM0SZH1_CAMSA|nr:PREDICTED: nuclear pore complex protein NUP98A-like [Camelina sativa]
MRIDFSEPECRNCYHCRTSGWLNNSQESQPRSVIGSSVTSIPVTSPGPVQEAPAHHSVAVGSTSTSTSSPFSFGSAPAPTSTSTSSPFSFGPVQSVPPTQSAATIANAFGSPSFQAPVLATSSGSGASGTSTSSTSSPAPVATTSVSFGPTQSLAPATFQSGSIFKAPVQINTGSGASATSTSSTSSPPQSSSLFGSAPAFTSVSSAPTPTLLGPIQDPVQAGASSSSTRFGNPAFARPDIGIPPVTSSSTTRPVFGASPFGQTQLFGASSTSAFSRFGCVAASPASGSSAFTSVFGYTPPAPSFSNRFGQNHRSIFDTHTEGLHSQFGSNSGANTSFPGFGVGYLPGTSSNLLSPNPPNLAGRSVGGVGPQPFGFNGATTASPSSPFSSPSIFSSNPNIGSQPFFASHGWSNHTEQGSRIPGYAPTATDDGQNKPLWDLSTGKGEEKYISISASKPYQHKSHEELRWDDYKRGDKGGLFPGAHTSPIGSRPNFDFTTLTGFFPGMTRYQSSISPPSTTVPPINSSVQRPHETATIPPPAHGCTACGATSSSSASGNFTFNGATTPPSAATTPPGMFFPTTGFGPMMFGTPLSVQGTTPPSAATTPPGMFFPTTGFGPMNFGTNLAIQGTTPALQAYPVQGYLFLPFAAMNLQ